MTEADITFLEEPIWAEEKNDQGRVRDVLRVPVMDNVEGKVVLLEQFAPDAYDLSEALVGGLGAIVKDKRAKVRAKLGQRKTSDGKLVDFLDGFSVEGA